MLGINSSELVVIGLLAALLLGPDRLPDLARQAAVLVRRGRDFARQAQAQMREEIGPEFDEVDWKRYDPRQYHPRRIVQNALSDTFDDEPTPRSKPARTGATTPARAASEAGRPGASTARSTGPGSTSSRPTSSGRTSVTGRGSGTSSAPRRPSPPPSSWAEAARHAGVDPDAT